MDDAELTKRLDAISEALSKIHRWQADRPSGPDLAARLDEILQTYGLTAQLVELWRRQRPEIQALYRDVGKLHEAVVELERIISELHQAVRAVGDEERG